MVYHIFHLFVSHLIHQGSYELYRGEKIFCRGKIGCCHFLLPLEVYNFD